MIPKSFNEQIGRKIKSIREVLEISSEEIADKTGISRNTLLEYEAGKSNITVSDLYKIVSVFNISLSYFLKDW